MIIAPDITPAQHQFLTSKKRVVYFKAGIQSGKTISLCFKAILCALKGESFLLVSFSYPFLRDTILRTIKRILIDIMHIPQKMWSINESSMTVTLNNTPIMLRSGDDPDSLRGNWVHKAGIDEARNFKTRYIYDVLIGRCSQGNDPQVFISSTSKGKNWVTQLRSEMADNFEQVSQTTLENPFISNEYKELLLSSYSTQYARQEIYGEEIDFGSGIINPNWFKIVQYRPVPVEAVRYWDVAVSTKTAADFSAGALLSIENETITIHDIIRIKVPYPELRRRIIDTAQKDGINTQIIIEEAGQQRGFIDDIAGCPELGQYIVKAQKPHGDKFNRAMPWVARAEIGQIQVCMGTWNNDWNYECDAFTANNMHEHDDMIDAVSGAYMALANTGSLIYSSAQLSQVKKDNVIDQDPTGMFKAFGVDVNKIFQSM